MTKKINYILIGLFIGLIATAYAAVPITFPINGGTGTNCKPTLGQVLVGNSSGTYNCQATSTLGISGSLSGGTTGWLSYWTSPTTLSAFATGTPGQLLIASSTSASGFGWTATSSLGISGGSGSGNSAWTIGSGLIYNATSTDKVGIGTSTPGYPLTVVGTSSLQDVLGKFFDKGGAVYNVKAYGAKCDGVTDDTTILQQVIGLASSTKGIVFIPQGTCLTSSSLVLDSNVTLQGVGTGKSIIKGGLSNYIVVKTNYTGTSSYSSYQNININNLSITSQYGFITGLTNISNLSVTDSEFYFSTSSALALEKESLFINNSEYVNVTGNYLHHLMGDGIQINGSRYFNVSENIIDGDVDNTYNADDLIDIDEDFLYSGLVYSEYGTVNNNTVINGTAGNNIRVASSKFITVDGNTIKTNIVPSASCILVNSYDGGDTNTTENIIISNNTITDCLSAGIQTSGLVVSNVLIEGNNINNSGQNSGSDARGGILLASENNTVRNNYINNTSKTGGDGAAINVYKNSNQTIVNNTISSSTNGILFWNGSGSQTYSNMVVQNNHFATTTNKYINTSAIISGVIEEDYPHKITGYGASDAFTVLGTSTLATTTIQNLRIFGALFDSVNASGTLGMVLQSTGTSTRWVATSSLGFGSGSGTVTSVSATTPTGLTVSSTTCTLACILNFTLTSGYMIPLTASTTEWSTAYASSSATSIRNQFSATYPIIYNSVTGIFSSGFSTSTTNIFSANNTFNASTTLASTTVTNLLVSGQTTLNTATATAFGITGLTNGSILFGSQTGLLSQNNSQFFWDNTNNRLAIGTTSPLSKFQIHSSNAPGSENGAISIRSTVTPTKALQFGYDDTLDVGWIQSLDKGVNKKNLFVDALNTGIGTGTPQARLVVTGLSSSNPLIIASTSGETIFQILNNGNSGFASTTPVTRLQVGAKVVDDNSYVYDTNSLLVTNQTPVSATALNDPRTVLFLARQSTAFQAYGTAATFNLSRFENVSANSRTRLDIGLANGSYDATSTYVMTMLSNGKVGVGSTSPISMLSVQGSGSTNPLTIASSTGTTLFQILANGNLGIGTTTPSQLLTVVSTSSLRDTIPETTNTYSLGASTTRWASLWSGIVNIGTSTWSLGQIGTRFGIFPQAQLGGTEAFSILADGKVGIGSTTPSDTLSVNGSINVTGSVKVNGVALSAGSGLSSLNGQTGSTQTFATTTTGTDFSVTSTGDVHTFAMPSASASARGLLSSTDWTTFNNKVSNAYASSTFPSFAYGSSSYYLASNPSGYISGNQSITLSGDVSGSGTTAITTTIGALKVLGSMIANATIDLTTKVTGILPIANGGTGTSTAPTFGKILMGNASGSYDLVATSSLGITGGGGGSLSGGATGLLALWSSATTLAQSLFMDNGTVTGIGATSTSARFNIASSTGNMMWAFGTNGQLSIATTTATTSIETGILGQIKLSALTYSGRDVLATKIASSSSSGIQAALWDKTISWWAPGATNGVMLGSSLTALTTATAIAPTAVNKYTTYRRSRWASVVTTNNQQVGLRTDAQYFRSATSTNSGWFYKATFGIDAHTANNRYFVGLSSCTTACLTGTTTLTNLANTIGFGVEGGTSQFVFLTNDASGAISTTTISGLPTLATNNGYDVYMYNPPTSSIVYWRIDNVNTGAKVAEGNVITNLPAVNTFMTAQVACSNGLNALANACQIGLASLYIEQEK